LSMNKKKRLLYLILAICVTASTLIGSIGLTASASSGSGTTASDSQTTSTAASAAGSGVEDGVLSVAMECSYAPYNWAQPDDSNGAVPIADSDEYANGYDIMMAKKICEAYGWKLEVHQLDWDSLIPAVQSGTVDAVIAGQSITAEREQEVDFAGPYLYASIVCLTKSSGKFADAKGISDLSGGSCTSQMGTIWYDNCLPQIQGATVQTAAESAPAMLMSLETGQVDYICTDYPTAEYALQAYPDFKILDFANSGDDFKVSDEDINIGISVRKGNTELKDKINAVVQKMSKEDFDEQMSRAASVAPLDDVKSTDDTTTTTETKSRFAQLGSDMASLWQQYGKNYLNGVRNTLLLALLGTFIGCLIGFLCGILQTIPIEKRDNPVKKFFLRLLRIIVRIYVEVFRGTPMILQAVFIFYGVPYFSNNTVQFTDKWSVALIVVSINTGAYMAESVRGGIISVDPGQNEGAKALGMTHFQTMLSVILPQALRNIMPQIGNNFIINVKDTSVMFIIGFVDFFAVHKSVSGATFTYFPSATIEMIGYLTMTLIASFLLRYLEKKLEGGSDYELVQKDPLTQVAGNYNYPDAKAKNTEEAKK